MRAGLIGLLVVLLGGAFIAANSLFVTNPAQQALVLQFGEVRQAVREPGLNTKIPFVQNVLYFDKRVLDLNVPTQEIIAADQKRLVVDAFVRYRVANPVRFYQTVNNVFEGAQRLSTFAQSSLRAVLADATFTDIVRDDRPGLMQRIKADVADRARDIGVQIVDVKILRADLPDANSEAIYRRMQTEREQEAEQIRAEGREAARRIRAAAQRQATVLVAEAQREAEQIRGQGDGRRNAIFASAFSADPEFFAFYRAMQAYTDALASDDTRLVLSPDADFFRFFNDPSGGARVFGNLSNDGEGTVAPAPAPAVIEVTPEEEEVSRRSADEILEELERQAEAASQATVDAAIADAEAEEAATPAADASSDSDASSSATGSNDEQSSLSTTTGSDTASTTAAASDAAQTAAAGSGAATTGTPVVPSGGAVAAADVGAPAASTEAGASATTSAGSAAAADATPSDSDVSATATPTTPSETSE